MPYIVFNQLAWCENESEVHFILFICVNEPVMRVLYINSIFKFSRTHNIYIIYLIFWYTVIFDLQTWNFLLSALVIIGVRPVPCSQLLPDTRGVPPGLRVIFTLRRFLLVTTISSGVLLLNWINYYYLKRNIENLFTDCS